MIPRPLATTPTLFAALLLLGTTCDSGDGRVDGRDDRPASQQLEHEDRSATARSPERGRCPCDDAADALFADPEALGEAAKAIVQSTAALVWAHVPGRWERPPVPSLVLCADDEAFQEAREGDDVHDVAGFADYERHRIVLAPGPSHDLVGLWRARPEEPGDEQLWSLTVLIHELVHFVRPGGHGRASEAAFEEWLEEGLTHDVASVLAWEVARVWIPGLMVDWPERYPNAVHMQTLAFGDDLRHEVVHSTGFGYRDSIIGWTLLAEYAGLPEEPGLEAWVRAALTFKAHTRPGRWRTALLDGIVAHHPVCRRDRRRIRIAMHALEPRKLAWSVSRCLGWPPELRLIGTTWCPACDWLEAQLDDRGTSYEYVDAEEEPESMEGLVDARGQLLDEDELGYPVLCANGACVVGSRAGLRAATDPPDPAFATELRLALRDADGERFEGPARSLQVVVHTDATHSVRRRVDVPDAVDGTVVRERLEMDEHYAVRAGDGVEAEALTCAELVCEMTLVVRDDQRGS